jgi:predicted small lipoprotein YifL
LEKEIKMKKIVLVLAVAALAGCGADGAPWTPSANVGISAGTGGVNTSTSLGATNGTFSVGANL